jgi:hypothetical protein
MAFLTPPVALNQAVTAFVVQLVEVLRYKPEGCRFDS